MAGIGNFNANDHKPMDSYDPLPAGKYPAMVVESDVKQAKSGQGHYAKLVWEITDGEYQGRKVYGNYNIQHANPKAQEIGQREFAAACRACGKMMVQDTEELHAIPCILKLRLTKNKQSGEPESRIAAYESANGGGQPPAAAMAPTPQHPAGGPALAQAATSSQPVTQPAPLPPTNTGKPIWQQ
ncbi:MAG: DUF669 domain-containing protein [Planctomycetota bacterium]